MAAIFRKLNQKRHWDNKDWLGSESVQADAAKCLASSDNTLSFYILDDVDTQLHRVVAALALTRDSLAHIDLAIVPESALDNSGIALKRVPATTPDSDVNNWHIDLVELTIDKISFMASAIRRSGNVRRYQRADVRTAIKTSLGAKQIVAERVNRKLISSLRKDGIVFS